MATKEETSEAGDDDGGEIGGTKGGGCIFWDLEKSFDADPPSRTCLRWLE